VLWWQHLLPFSRTSSVTGAGGALLRCCAPLQTFDADNFAEALFPAIKAKA